jgi:hypothetical protein
MIGRPKPDWERGNYVFYDEGEKLGVAQFVSDLEDGTTEFVIAGLDEDFARWCSQRLRTGERSDFVVRDNRKKRWVNISAGWLQSEAALSGQYTWVCQSISEADGRNG